MDDTLSELNEALLSLEGLLCGIVSDDIVNEKELEKLFSWKKQHYHKIKHHPVAELIRMLDTVMGCRIMTGEERAFIEDFCREFGCCKQNHDPLLCDSIRMKGYVDGILADSKIYEGEIRSFRSWLLERPHMKKHTHYDLIIKKTEDFITNRSLKGDELFGFLSELRESL